MLLGSAAFAGNDISDRTDLESLLACVFVKLEAKGRGLAAKLIKSIFSLAKFSGVNLLYLHTDGQQSR